MGIFKKLKEFDKLSKSFGRFYVLLDKLEEKSKHNDVSNEMAFLAYMGRTEIIDRMEKYNWSPNSKMMIAEFRKTTTIINAYSYTIGELIKLSKIIGNFETIENVLEKGNIFYEIEKLKD